MYVSDKLAGRFPDVLPSTADAGFWYCDTHDAAVTAIHDMLTLRLDLGYFLLPADFAPPTLGWKSLLDLAYLIPHDAALSRDYCLSVITCNLLSFGSAISQVVQVLVIHARGKNFNVSVPAEPPVVVTLADVLSDDAIAPFANGQTNTRGEFCPSQIDPGFDPLAELWPSGWTFAELSQRSAVARELYAALPPEFRAIHRAAWCGPLIRSDGNEWFIHPWNWRYLTSAEWRAMLGYDAETPETAYPLPFVQWLLQQADFYFSGAWPNSLVYKWDNGAWAAENRAEGQLKRFYFPTFYRWEKKTLPVGCIDRQWNIDPLTEQLVRPWADVEKEYASQLPE